MMAVPLGVCFSQASGLVKGGKVNLYPGDGLVPLKPGNFLGWGLGVRRGQARKECLSGAVSTLLRKEVPGSSTLTTWRACGDGSGVWRGSPQSFQDGVQEFTFLASSQMLLLLLV